MKKWKKLIAVGKWTQPWNPFEVLLLQTSEWTKRKQIGAIAYTCLIAFNSWGILRRVQIQIFFLEVMAINLEKKHLQISAQELQTPWN